MKILLTGATGFIGSQLARRLVADGNDLAVVVRPDSQLNALQAVQAAVQVHVYDGTAASLRLALETAKPELVIHVASLFLASHRTQDVSRLVQSNLQFPLQLLQAMSELGIRRFINTGTSWQHYQDREYSPVNLYAATKQAFEALLAHYVEADGFQAITLKLFDTYGPGDTRPKLFSLLRKTVKSGETLRMSPGQQMLDLVYIDDVLDAYVRAIARMPFVIGAEIYGVSNPDRLSLRELVRIYGETVGLPLNVEWGGLPYRPREVLTLWTSHQAVPGWEVRVSLVEGIVRMEKDRNVGGLLSGGAP